MLYIYSYYYRAGVQILMYTFDVLDNHDGMLDPMELLDPELRPIPPQPGCEPSMQIYQDHRRVS